MKLRLLLLAGLASLSSGTAQAQGPLSSYDCQPLTQMNKFECCNAPNWREIILPGSQSRCDRDDVRLEEDDAVGSITAPDDDRNTLQDDDDGDGNTPPDDDNNGNGPPAQSSLGNPGNQMDVGKAGEKNMAHEGEGPAYGTRGNSNDQADGNPSGVGKGKAGKP